MRSRNSSNWSWRSKTSTQHFQVMWLSVQVLSSISFVGLVCSRLISQPSARCKTVECKVQRLRGVIYMYYYLRIDLFLFIAGGEMVDCNKLLHEVMLLKPKLPSTTPDVFISDSLHTINKLESGWVGLGEWVWVSGSVWVIKIETEWMIHNV